MLRGAASRAAKGPELLAYRTPAYRFFFVRRLFFLVETGRTSEKVDEVLSVGSIGAQAVVLVLTFPSLSVVVVRMGMGILLGALPCRPAGYPYRYGPKRRRERKGRSPPPLRPF